MLTRRSQDGLLKGHLSRRVAPLRARERTQQAGWRRRRDLSSAGIPVNSRLLAVPATAG